MLISLYINTLTSELYSYLLILWLGVDTKTAFCGLGKLEGANLISKSTEAKSQAELFTKPEMTKESFQENGNRFILSMYGLSRLKDLDEARYFKFKQLTAKTSLKSTFNLTKLPPTANAAHQHIFRAYHQIQIWLDNKLPAEEWDWRCTTTNRLIQVPITNPPAPSELLLLISCNCKTSCVTNCSCRKARFDCTPMCGHCSGLHCNNISDHDDEIFEED